MKTNANNSVPLDDETPNNSEQGKEQDIVRKNRSKYRSYLEVNGRDSLNATDVASNGQALSDRNPEQDRVSEAFPYLETINVTARKHPYVMLIAIVGAVGTVLAAIASACVILFSSFFTMYGTMREIQLQQRIFIENQTVLMSELKVMRTYNASVLSRQNFIAGLMSPDEQKRLMEYDRSNPLYQPPPPKFTQPNNDDQ